MLWMIIIWRLILILKWDNNNINVFIYLLTYWINRFLNYYWSIFCVLFLCTIRFLFSNWLIYLFIHSSDAYRSVAATSSWVIPSSAQLCPASGTTINSAWLSLYLRSYADFIGHTISYRPWMITVGIFASFVQSSRSWSSCVKNPPFAK